MKKTTCSSSFVYNTKMPEIDNYKAIPIRLTPNANNSHFVYMREHFIRQVDTDKPKGRTLFLLNVPPYVSEDNLKICFSKIGQVNDVLFADKPGREESNKSQRTCPFIQHHTFSKFKVAFIVFQNTDSIVKSLKLQSIDLFDESAKSVVISGIAKWKREYDESRLKESTIQKQIDDYMEVYDIREKKKQQAERNSAADSDGWITVGKQGRNAGFEQKESVINRLEDKIERGRKNKELKNFYTFQIRESKMQNVVSLRKKFEEDKNKIEILKKRRRFKPF